VPHQKIIVIFCTIKSKKYTLIILKKDKGRKKACDIAGHIDRRENNQVCGFN
jgi:hypothetical protein